MIPKEYKKYEKNITLSCVNFNSVWGNKTATLGKMKTKIEEAASFGSNMIAFPELALSGYECSEDCRRDLKPCSMHRDAAETIPGPSTEEIVKLAKKLNVYVVFGMPERDKRNRKIQYISTVVIGAEGIVGTYRKLHLGGPPRMTENICFTPGNELPVFETRYGPIGIQICYDFWIFPEMSRILTFKGARLIINTTASSAGPGKIEFLERVTVVRAIENRVYTASADMVGKEMTASYSGHSTIAGPSPPRQGHIYVEAGDGEEIITATLNFETLHQWQQGLSWKQDHQSQLISQEFAKIAATKLVK